MSARYLLIIGAVASISTIIFYSFGVLYPDFFKTNSQWGDFSGGALGPILTFFGFIGLLYTIKIQSDELASTREELSRSAIALESQNSEQKKQSFENTFFRMLEFHASIVNSLHIHRSDKDYIGRDCFILYNKQLRNNIKDLHLSKDGDLPIEFNERYAYFWASAGYQLGHYYRYLYHFIKFTDHNKGYGALYIKLIRAQITDGELVLLFYNANSELGAKLKPLLDEHYFFDNLRDELLIIKSPEEQT